MEQAQQDNSPALVINSFVRIGLLGVDAAVVLDVLEGVVHQTSVAPVVTIRLGAVDQVLFRERHQVPSLTEVLTFEGTRLLTNEFVVRRNAILTARMVVGN